MDWMGVGTGAVFSHQPNISMVSYLVHVEVDVPYINEVYEYFLRNEGDSVITIQCIIPYNFGRLHDDFPYTMHWDSETETSYKEYEHFDISIDDVDVSYDAVRDITVDFPEMEYNTSIPKNGYVGFGINVTFGVGQTVKVRMNTVGLNMNSGIYFENFEYFYSAATSRFWAHNTVQFGEFLYNHTSNFKEFLVVNIPSGDGVIDDVSKSVFSRKENFNADDAIYEVIVDTGVRYGGSPWYLFRLIMNWILLGGIGLIVICTCCVISAPLIIVVIIIIICFIRAKKANNMDMKSVEMQKTETIEVDEKISQSQNDENVKI